MKRRPPDAMFHDFFFFIILFCLLKKNSIIIIGPHSSSHPRIRTTPRALFQSPFLLFLLCLLPPLRFVSFCVY